jgi:hypothetical protein
VHEITEPFVEAVLPGFMKTQLGFYISRIFFNRHQVPGSRILIQTSLVEFGGFFC